MSALYRTYRPQLFADVVGQAHIKITLQNELNQDKLAHAYLFCGARGLGKTSVARLLAKAVNCQNRVAGASEPCNKCRMCQDLMDQRSADVIEIDAASNTGIDNVRENIIDTARFSPSIGKYKVFIIDEVHMLSTAAFNALLKTLEEPPRHVIFILCTTETHKVPETIISRCQRFDFKRVSVSEMHDRLAKIVQLENKKLAESVFDDIGRLSDGCLRDAESLLAKILMLGDDISADEAHLILPHTDLAAALDLIEYIHSNNATAGIELVNRMLEQGVNLDAFTNESIELMRQILLAKTDPALMIGSANFDQKTQDRLNNYAKTMTYDRIIEIISSLSAVREQFKTAFIIQLPLEIAVVKLTGLAVNHSVPTERVQIQQTPPAPLPPPPPPAPKKEVAPTPVVQIETSPPTPVESVVETVPVVTNVVVDEAVVEDAESTTAVVELSTVVGRWEAIVNKLRETNYSLSSVLRLSRPMAINGHKLEVAVQNAFYKDRIEHASSLEMFKLVSQELLGAGLTLMGLIDGAVNPLIAMPNPVASAPAKLDLPPVTGAVSSGLVENNNQINISVPAKSMNPVEDALGLF